MQHGVPSLSPHTLHPQVHTAYSLPPVTCRILRGVQCYSEMVEHIQQIIAQYQQRIAEKPYVPIRSYGHSALGINGNVNRAFLTFPFSNKDVGIQFLKDVSLIHSKVPCNACGREMKWCADPTSKDGFRWRCRRKVAEAKCSQSQGIRHGSWFQQSNLTFQEVLYLTYDIVCRVPAHQIRREYAFSSKTIADWGMFCRETMLMYVEGCSEKIGFPNKTVEIDESMFGRRKYNRGHPVKGQWVFGGVERESGRTFLVPVPNRTADTLVTIIDAWIEPGTTVISDCWAAYRDLAARGYTHRTVNQTISFVNEEGDHVEVGSREGVPKIVQEAGRLRIPLRSLHVRGKVQG